jgi:hypothetical protein
MGPWRGGDWGDEPGPLGTRLPAFGRQTNPNRSVLGWHLSEAPVSTGDKEADENEHCNRRQHNFIPAGLLCTDLIQHLIVKHGAFPKGGPGTPATTARA